MASENKEVKIVAPWFPGPINDEWDNPGYDNFWNPIECAVNQQILEIKKEGK